MHRAGILIWAKAASGLPRAWARWVLSRPLTPAPAPTGQSWPLREAIDGSGSRQPPPVLPVVKCCKKALRFTAPAVGPGRSVSAGHMVWDLRLYKGYSETLRGVSEAPSSLEAGNWIQLYLKESFQSSLNVCLVSGSQTSRAVRCGAAPL